MIDTKGSSGATDRRLAVGTLGLALAWAPTPRPDRLYSTSSARGLHAGRRRPRGRLANRGLTLPFEPDPGDRSPAAVTPSPGVILIVSHGDGACRRRRRIAAVTIMSAR
jgi:hypothetical protein